MASPITSENVPPQVVLLSAKHTDLNSLKITGAKNLARIILETKTSKAANSEAILEPSPNPSPLPLPFEPEPPTSCFHLHSDPSAPPFESQENPPFFPDDSYLKLDFFAPSDLLTLKKQCFTDLDMPLYKADADLLANAVCDDSIWDFQP